MKPTLGKSGAPCPAPTAHPPAGAPTCAASGELSGACAIVHGLATTLGLDGNLDERATDKPPAAAAEATPTAFGTILLVATGVDSERR